VAARLVSRAVIPILLLLLAGSLVAFRIPLVEAGGDVIAGGPRARHLWWLRITGRMDEPAAEAWDAAGREALHAPRGGALPAAVTLEPPGGALGVAVDLRRGQRLDVRVAGDEQESPARIFLEVFEVVGGEPARRPAGHTVTPAALGYEATGTGRHVVRVQGELGTPRRVEATITAGPSLVFPVANAGGQAIRSAFGVEREGGRRRHEGVDIFAPRGTSVLSASGGLVTSVGENRLGGLVVWVWNPSRGLLLYYAHLDRQVAHVGQRVAPGDLLGTVGTTGNARTTPPHLHFGIYSGTEGAIDPEPFIRDAGGPSADLAPSSFTPSSFVPRPSSLDPWSWHPDLWPLPHRSTSISSAGTPRSSTRRSGFPEPASASGSTRSSVWCLGSAIWPRRSSPPRCS
jgi:murein DD-endopeptidase MepM/ murein hydrolase activator NlpD